MRQFILHYHLFYKVQRATMPGVSSRCNRQRVRWQTTSSITGTIPFLGEGVSVGQYAQLEKCFSIDQVDAFGDLVGDKNVLHSPMGWDRTLETMPHLEIAYKAGLVVLEDVYNESNSVIRQTKPLVHGMLVASLFSSIFGTLSPGCIYMNQSLQFRAPVFVKETVQAKIEIQKVRTFRKGGVVVDCETLVFKNSNHDHPLFDTTAIQGTANVWLPSGHQAS